MAGRRRERRETHQISRATLPRSTRRRVKKTKNWAKRRKDIDGRYITNMERQEQEYQRDNIKW